MKTQALVLFTALPCLMSAASAATVSTNAEFADRTPARYEAVSSVVFQYRWFKFPALGVMSVDARKHNFALVGLSQLGISVFELSDKNGIVKSRMPGPLLKRNPRLATGAASDVRNMFFNLAPAPDASRRDAGRLVIFQKTTPEGTLEHRFDKATGLLVEKRLAVRSKLLPCRTVIWVVRYDDHAKSDGKTWPRSVRFKNRKLHYVIATRVREMRIKQ
jgi:hypothetical protein